MTLEITDASQDYAGWDAFVQSHPDGTLFHRPGWERAVAATFGYAPRSRIARRGRTIYGVLPVALVPLLPVGKALVSTPLGVYGGILANEPEAGDALLADVRSTAIRTRAKYVELRHRMPRSGLPTKSVYVTFVRDLSPEDDTNFAQIPRNQRRSIRLAERNGLRARLGGRELLADFYGVYAESVHNLGTPVFPRSLFDALISEFPHEHSILTVDRDDRVLAAVLSFYFRDQVLPYYGGTRREGLRLGATDFMYWTLMKDAARRGCRRFDFGRSNVESGAYHFKRHWGFTPEPLAYQYLLAPNEEIPDLSPRNPRFSIAIALWRRIPLWLATRLGPKLVRFFP